MRLHGGTTSISTRKKFRISEWPDGPFFLPAQNLVGPNGGAGVVSMLIQSAFIQNGGMHVVPSYSASVLLKHHFGDAK